MPRLPFSLKVHLARLWLYVALLLFSGTLVGLTGARLRYTLHLPSTDPLNNGKPFYDKIAAELFATSVFTFFWSAHMIHTIKRSVERRGFFGRLAFELLFLWCLWILYLIGAAISTNLWGDLSFCWQYHACRLLTALVAFSWIGWVTLSVLGITSFIFAFTKHAWTKPCHTRWMFSNKENHSVNA